MTAILTHPADSRSVRPRAADTGACRPRTGRPASVGPRVVQPAGVYRRRRLLVLAVVISLVVGLWSYGSSSQPTSTTATRSLDAVVVVVQPGETLWSIATWLDPGADPRRLVDELSDLTGSTTLQPGQRLVIPADLIG